MNNLTLYNQYFKQGTPGYLIIQAFNHKYKSSLTAAGHSNLDDVIHEIYISISKSELKHVQNKKHYIHRAIKLQCWTLLDKAIKSKNVIPESKLQSGRIQEDNSSVIENEKSQTADPAISLETAELIKEINLFKTQLNNRDIHILNSLIDEKSRTEIAQIIQLNLNTVDTQIRRLRIKLTKHLKTRGYHYDFIDKFAVFISLLTIYFTVKVYIQNSDLYT
jgi:DNA-directed RNA polymerase specialized sigma24 family protein